MRFRNYKKILSEQVSEFSPESDWKKSSRDALLAQIRQTKPWQEPEQTSSFGSIFSAMFASHMLKPVLAGFLVFTTLMYSSVITVQAAKASLPGDRLYPVKLGIEEVQVGLVFSEERKAELEVGFAGNRLKEVNEIIKKEDTEDTKDKKKNQENIKKAMQGFSKNLDSVQKRLEKIEKSPQTEKKVLEISKLVNEKTQELEDDLLEIKEKITVSDEIAESEDSESEELIESVEDEDNVATTTTDIIDVATTTIDVVATTTTDINIEEILEEDLDEGEGDFLDALETALISVDEANTKSLEVFVGKAATSGNEEIKQDAVDKLHKKIKKVQQDISEDASEKEEEVVVAEKVDSEVDSEEEFVVEEISAQAKETIDQAKKILNENSTEVISEVIEKIIQAKAIVVEENKEQESEDIEEDIIEDVENNKIEQEDTEIDPVLNELDEEEIINDIEESEDLS